MIESRAWDPSIPRHSHTGRVCNLVGQTHGETAESTGVSHAKVAEVPWASTSEAGAGSFEVASLVGDER